jgi:hypothetical protein
MRQGEHKSRSGQFGGEKYQQLLMGIESGLLHHPDHSVVTVSNLLSQILFKLIRNSNKIAMQTPLCIKLI